MDRVWCIAAAYLQCVLFSKHELEYMGGYYTTTDSIANAVLYSRFHCVVRSSLHAMQC